MHCHTEPKETTQNNNEQEKGDTASRNAHCDAVANTTIAGYGEKLPLPRNSVTDANEAITQATLQPVQK